MIEKLRLALYEPWGRKLATVTDYSSLSWVHPLNSHSTLSVSLPDGAEDATLLKPRSTANGLNPSHAVSSRPANPWIA